MTADFEDVIKEVLEKELEALRYDIDHFDMEELHGNDATSGDYERILKFS
jgi:hypothetical protein